MPRCFPRSAERGGNLVQLMALGAPLLVLFGWYALRWPGAVMGALAGLTGIGAASIVQSVWAARQVRLSLAARAARDGLALDAESWNALDAFDRIGEGIRKELQQQQRRGISTKMVPGGLWRELSAQVYRLARSIDAVSRDLAQLTDSAEPKTGGELTADMVRDLEQLRAQLRIVVADCRRIWERLVRARQLADAPMTAGQAARQDLRHILDDLQHLVDAYRQFHSEPFDEAKRHAQQRRCEQA